MRRVRAIGLYASIVAAACLVALCFGAALGHMFGDALADLIDQAEPPADKQSNGIQEGTFRVLEVLSSVIVACCTYLLWRVSKDQKTLLGIANDNAATATKAFVNAERGRVMWESCCFAESGAMLEYRLKNVGRSTVVIESIGLRFRPALRPNVDAVGRYVIEREAMNAPVIGGDSCTNRAYFPLYCFEAGVQRSDLRPTVVQFSVVYSTMGIRAHYWCNWLIDLEHASKATGDGYEREDDIDANWPGDDVLMQEGRIDEALRAYAASVGDPIPDNRDLWKAEVEAAMRASPDAETLPD